MKIFHRHKWKTYIRVPYIWYQGPSYKEVVLHIKTCENCPAVKYVAKPSGYLILEKGIHGKAILVDGK
jgi:hypothetical protein